MKTNVKLFSILISILIIIITTILMMSTDSSAAASISLYTSGLSTISKSGTVNNYYKSYGSSLSKYNKIKISSSSYSWTNGSGDKMFCLTPNATDIFRSDATYPISLYKVADGTLKPYFAEFLGNNSLDRRTRQVTLWRSLDYSGKTVTYNGKSVNSGVPNVTATWNNYKNYVNSGLDWYYSLQDKYASSAKPSASISQKEEDITKTTVTENGVSYYKVTLKVEANSSFKNYVIKGSIKVTDNTSGKTVSGIAISGSSVSDGKVVKGGELIVKIPTSACSGNAKIELSWSYSSYDSSDGATANFYVYTDGYQIQKQLTSAIEQFIFYVKVSPITVKGGNSVEIETNSFDMALRKSIVKIESTDKDGNTYNKYNSTARLPNVDVSALTSGTTADYKHAKNALGVELGDLVTYQIKLYNEGSMDGKVKEITDYLPPELEFVEDNAINTQYGWTVSEDGRTVKTTYLKDIVLKGYNGKNLESESKTVSIVCRVKSRSTKAITNIAEITKSVAVLDGKEDKTVTDRDSTTKNLDKPEDSALPSYKGNSKNKTSLTDSSYHYKGQEDDDDFEKIKLVEFDLALRKYITDIERGDQKVSYNARDLENIDTTKLQNATGTTADYKHVKTPADVAIGDIVTYTIKIYNEAQLAGYAMEIKDYLPAQLEYISDNEINQQYGWVLSEDGRTITTDYLKNDQIEAYVIKDKETEKDILSSKTLQVVCRVVETENMPELLTNIAEITKYKAIANDGTDGSHIKDRDSEEENVKKLSGITDATLPSYIGNGNKSDLTDSNYYYKGYQDDDDFEKVKIQKFDLSGFVFEDVSTSKGSKTFDGIYTEDKDVDGVGDRLLEGMKVILYKDGKEFKVTRTNSEGKYSFSGLPAGPQYTVGVEYNGQNYEPTLYVNDNEKGSRASENYDERKTFNDNFGTITKDSGTLSPKTNTTVYKPQIDNNTDLNENFRIKAYVSTPNNNYNTKKIYQFSGDTQANFGIKERDLNDIGLINDLSSVALTLTNQNKKYEILKVYDSRQDALNFEIETRPEDYYSTKYQQEVRNADYESASLSATGYYTIYLSNSGNYLAKANSIYVLIDDETYTFDGAYYIPGVNNVLKSLDNIDSNLKDDKKLQVLDNTQIVEYNGRRYRKYSIKTSDIDILRGNLARIYVKVTSKKDANDKLLLDIDRTIVAEVESYSTYYGTYVNNAKENDPNKKNYIAENFVGRIDRNSNPENYDVSENDMDSAPYFKFVLSNNNEREVNGDVWEDIRDQEVGNALIGDGIRDNKEKGLANITVELVETDTGDTAKVYDLTKKAWANAITKTDENGKYKITGFLPGDYYVRFTYDDGLTYKSTTYQADKVNKSFDVNNPDTLGVYTETKDNERYSDARDVYAKRTTVNSLLTPQTNKKLTELENDANTLLKQMQAKTGNIAVNIEKMENRATVTTLEPLEYKYNNLDFGLQQRAKAQLVTKKEISHIVVKLSTGEIQIDAAPETTTTNVTWINKDGETIKVSDVYDGKTIKSNAELLALCRTKLNQLASLTMDKEIMQGATINITYKITVKNIGEVAYDSKEFYYLGLKKGNVVDTTINTIIDYPGAALTESTKVLKGNLKFDSTLKGNEGWSLLTNEEREEFIQESIRNKEAKDYASIIKYNFAKKLTPAIEDNDNSEATATLTLTSAISSSTDSDSLSFNNLVELASISDGVGRKMAYTTVGNQKPNEDPAEIDADDAVVTILPPFGQTNIYYYIAGGVLVILAVGIVIIKTKVVKKH